MKRFIRVYGSGSGSVRHPAYDAAAYYLPFLWFFFYKTRANTQQELPVQTVCTSTLNERCKKLTIKSQQKLIKLNGS